MTPQKLADDLCVLPQIKPEDVKLLAAAGFRSIISNRPDGEAEDQPSFSEICSEAQRNGIETRHLPVVTNKISDEDIAAFKLAIEALPKPILAYCRTGTRCTYLWALSEAPVRSMDEIVSRANDAGYDLKNIEERLHSIQSECASHKLKG